MFLQCRAPQHTPSMADDLCVCARWSESASATEFADATCIFDATRDAIRLVVHSATPVRRSLERVCWAQALLQHVNDCADDVRVVFVTQRATASRRCCARKKTAVVTCQQCARKSAIAARCRQCERPSRRVRHTCRHTRALRTRDARKSATAATYRQRTSHRRECLVRASRSPLANCPHEAKLLLDQLRNLHDPRLLRSATSHDVVDSLVIHHDKSVANVKRFHGDR